MQLGRRPPRRRAAQRCLAALQQGYALLAMMILVAAVFAGSLTVVTRWSDAIHREREQELLQVGDEIAAAIASYHAASAGGTKRFPPELADLLLDRRAFGLMRHLRRIRPDPMTRSSNWGVVRADDGGIMGVYSLSTEVPMRETPVTLTHTRLAAAQRYADWKFMAQVIQ